MGMISTQGWDTAFALRLPDINKAIVAAVKKGELSMPRIDWKSKGWSLSGEFDLWQLTSEGLQNTGGTAVNMLFPIKHARLSGDGESYDLASVTAVGTVQLVLVADGTRHKLVVDQKKGVQIREILGGNPESADYFRDPLGKFLQGNLAAFKHAFAVVDLNHSVANQIPWLGPKAVGYCYSGGKDDNGSYLAVLCMTDNYVAGNPTPAPTLSSDLIPDGAHCAFLLSRSLFTRNLLLPGIVDGLKLRCDAATEKKLKGPELQKARQDRWFELQDLDARIVKKPKTSPIPLGEHAVDVSWLYAVIGTGSGLAINPWLFPPSVALAAVTFFGNMIAQGKPAIMAELALRIDKLEVASGDGEVSFKTSLHGDLKLPLLPSLFKDLHLDLATVRVDVTTAHTPELSTDGKFHFRKKGTPVHSNPVVEPAEWVKTAAIVEKVILSVISLVLTVATDGIASGLFAVEAAISEGGLRLLSMGLVLSTEEAAKKGMPVDFVSFVDTAISPVQWTGIAGLKPTSIALGEALLIAGNPPPVEA